MNSKQRDLMIKRFIFEPQKYGGNEPEVVRKNSDVNFCKSFFNKTMVDEDLVKKLLNEAILNENEQELDLILMLLEHFNIINHFNVMLAKLLIQPWHHFHDRIAGILEFNASENIIEYLYKGALYSCDNLEYESDYCEFNRKCLYALAKIGTKESINYIKEVLKNGNDIVSNYAKTILKEYKF